MVRMLVAIDGSRHARKAAEVAARLAKELRAAEIVVLTVGHIPSLVTAGATANAMAGLGALEESQQAAWRAILDETMPAFAGVDVPVTREYRRGEPSTEILKCARAHQADLIVMGSRGLGQIGGLVLGSVSERVLHAARIPVLIVR